MPVDQDRYRSLIARAAFDCSFYKGTIQDLSPAARAMSFVGAPTWGKVNGIPCLKQGAAGSGTTSAATAAIVDPAGAFSVELLCRVDISASYNALLRQISAGGFTLYNDTAAKQQLLLYNAAGAIARQINMSGNGQVGKWTHHVVVSTTGGTAGQWHVGGVPAATALAGAGVAVPCAATPVLCGGFNAGLSSSLIIRAFPFALGNEDVSALYGSAHILTGGEV